MLQDNTPDSIGAQILARYQHPASWEDGSATGKGDLVGKKVLKVEEIRMGGFAFVSVLESEANAKAILAWAASVGIKAYELRLQRECDKAPYVVVTLRRGESRRGFFCLSSVRDTLRNVA